MQTHFVTDTDIATLDKILWLATMHTERIFMSEYNAPELINYRNYLIELRRKIYEIKCEEDPNAMVISQMLLNGGAVNDPE